MSYYLLEITPLLNPLGLLGQHALGAGSALHAHLPLIGQAAVYGMTNRSIMQTCTKTQARAIKIVH